MTDNSEHLIASAKMRSAAARRRTEAVLDDSQRMREVDSVVALARAARVSRSWLYTQPTLLQRLHARSAAAPEPRRPATAASDASLLRRLEQAHHRNRELDEQNRRLRDELARAYGQLREAGYRRSSTR